jgi:thiol-disulfide isomerase/thioredoxin
MSRQNWLVGVLAALALAAGLGVANWLRQPASIQPGAAETLLSAPMPDLQNQPQTLDRYRGKILVVNFWATWCPPCRAEIPFFVEAQKKFGADGLQFVGIAIDNPRQVAAFVQEYAVNYPVLVGGTPELEMLRKLGNPGGGLPYTLIFDRDGKLRQQIIGGLDSTRLEHILAPLI